MDLRPFIFCMQHEKTLIGLKSEISLFMMGNCLDKQVDHPFREKDDYNHYNYKNHR